jgi:hypothetical protein
VPNGQWSGAPFVPSADWFEKWIKQDPSWVYPDETYQQYWQDFVKSGQMFDYALATDNPNLQAFKADGGKLIMWQGLVLRCHPHDERTPPRWTPLLRTRGSWRLPAVAVAEPATAR